MLIQESETMTCKKILAALALALGVQTGASAAIVTIDGDFFDISFDNALFDLFGSPTIVGDAVVWTPSADTGFAAEAGFGLPQVKKVSDTVTITIVADPGYKLTGSSLTESGNYYYFGDATVGVKAAGDLRMTGLGPLAGPVVSTLTTSAFVKNDNFDFDTQNWSGSASVVLGTQISSATVSIYNLLAAWAIPPDVQSAYIEKRNVTLSVGVVPIPEPSTWAMLGLGVGMIGFAIRRKMR